MQITVENSDYAVEYTAVNMDVAVSPQAEINVAVGDAARIDVGEALNYIKSGQAEIEQAVADGTAAFNLNASQKTIAFNNNASNKTTDFNNNASDKTTAFNNNATAKTGDFNDNATNKTNAFNQNATDKTDAFNLNATNKTTDFNDNYTAKKALIDAEVATASGYAATAKQWAIGDPSEPVGNSAKYWADTAAATLANKQDKLTVGAGIDITSDVISNAGVRSVATGASNGTISVNTNGTSAEVSVYGLGSAAYTASTAYATAAQGAKADTAVQPGDLATVATTGNYSDLLNKPTIPAAQVNSDWNANSGVAQILNKPTIPTVDQTYNASSTNAQSGVAVASAISGKADDNAVVHLAGTETITGDKTFTGSLTIPANTIITKENGNPDEGGELQFEVGTNSVLQSAVKLDVYKNRLRIFGTDSNGVANEVFNANIENNYCWLGATPTTSSNDTTVATTAFVKNILSELYPVGSIYIGTQSTCPLATLISGSTWTLVSKGRVLQGVDTGQTAGSTVAAGLPNITGLSGLHASQGEAIWNSAAPSGALYDAGSPFNKGTNNVASEGSRIAFDASRSNSIYGSSSTVQPPAYLVNIWERTA